MKYDARMVQFHGDIVEAIRGMIHGDSDKAKELASDSSPTPLREYLKKEHGARYHGGNRFDCSCSCFLVVFDSRINELGETRLQMSWSQVANFIRDNPSEIFGEGDKSEQDKSEQSGFPCDDCGYDEKGCCNYPETPDDYCVCGDKQIPKSEGTYLEIFKEHYPNVNCEELYYDYCPGDFFEGAMDSMCNACTNICKNCWNTNAHEEWCETADSVPEGWKAVVEPEHKEEEQSDEKFNRAKTELENFVSSVDEKKMDCPHWIKGKTLNNKGFGVIEFECAMHKESFFEECKIKHFLTTHCYNQIWCPFCEHPEAVQNPPAEPPAPAPAQTETAVVFDYSELDTDTAEQLGKISESVINIKKKYIFDMAEQVKKAHDLLANCKNGLFGAWCMSIGISRDTGNNLVNIAELFGNISAEQQENLNKLTDGNVKLLYEAARPSAPAELVEAVKNGDITTHKEYIALKKQLEEAEQKVDKLHESNQKMRMENIAALVRADKAEKQLAETNKKMEELESRPIEVAVDVDELNRRVEKVSIELQNQTARQIAAEREDFARKLNSMEDENDELRAELEKAKSAKANDNVKTVLMRMTLDELAELAEVVPDGKFKTIIKKAQVLRA